MIKRVHLIFVLEEVVFVNIFNLELVILRATCFYAIFVVEYLQGVFTIFVSTRAYRCNISVAKDVIAFGQHIGQLKLVCINHLPS